MREYKVPKGNFGASARQSVVVISDKAFNKRLKYLGNEAKIVKIKSADFEYIGFSEKNPRNPFDWSIVYLAVSTFVKPLLEHFNTSPTHEWGIDLQKDLVKEELAPKRTTQEILVDLINEGIRNHVHIHSLHLDAHHYNALYSELNMSCKKAVKKKYLELLGTPTRAKVYKSKKLGTDNC